MAAYLIGLCPKYLLLSITDMFWVFGRYNKGVKDKEVSDARRLEVPGGQSGEIRMIESAACNNTETQRALSEDVQSDISSDTDSDDTDYDAMYSDETDSDAMDSDGENPDDSSSEDEDSSAMNNDKQPRRPRTLRVPSLAEVYLRSQSQPDRILAGSKKTDTPILTVRQELDKRMLIEQTKELSAQFGSEARSPEALVPLVKTQT